MLISSLDCSGDDIGRFGKDNHRFVSVRIVIVGFVIMASLRSQEMSRRDGSSSRDSIDDGMSMESRDTWDAWWYLNRDQYLPPRSPIGVAFSEQLLSAVRLGAADRMFETRAAAAVSLGKIAAAHPTSDPLIRQD